MELKNLCFKEDARIAQRQTPPPVSDAAVLPTCAGQCGVRNGLGAKADICMRDRTSTYGITDLVLGLRDDANSA